MAADGSLKFDTRINTEGFVRGSVNLKQAAKSLMESISGVGKSASVAFDDTSTVINYKNKIESTTNQIKLLEEELKKLEAAPARAKEADMERYRKKIADAELQMEQLLTMREALELQLLPPGLPGHSPEATQSIYENNREWQRLTRKIDEAAEALRKYENEQSEIQASGVEDYQNAKYQKIVNRIAQLNGNLAQYKKRLSEIIAKENQSSKSSDRMARSHKRLSSSMRSTKKAATPLTKSILKLSNMFKLMLIRMAMRAAIQGAREGFQNLAQYSDETNESLSQLMSAGTKFKNSFATAIGPALQACTPALKQMIDLLSAGAAYAGQFIAAMTGKSTFVKAVDVEEDYAASLKESNKELKEKEKETKKLAFAFDDLIQAQGGNKVDIDAYKPPTPDQMFETVEVESDIKDFAETVKDVLDDLFDPMKRSWEEKGSTVIASAKYALGELKNFGKDVGDSFMTVWEKEGYGKAITDDVLISVSNLLDTVGNLAKGMDKAWKSSDTGLLIMRHLGDLVLEVTGFFRDATGEIKKWSKTMDFSPLFKSFDNILVKTKPIVSKIGDALLWLLKDILLPLAKWGIENGIPSAFDLIAAALGALDAVLDALKPMAMWLWKEFLQPLGKWAGEIFIAAMQKIVEWLNKFSDWVSTHRTEVEGITVIILAFFAAWKFTQFVSGILSMVTIFGTLSSILSIFKIDLGAIISKLALTTLKFSALTLALTGIISVIAILARNWNSMSPSERVISSILAAASAVSILAVALGAVKGAAGAALVAGALAAGIAAATIAISAGKRSASSSSNGGYGRSSTYSGYALDTASYRIPRLATGTVVPPRAGEFAAILGDNNRDTEIVSPVPAMKQAFKEAIEEMGGLGGGNQTLRADLIVDGTKFGQLVYKFNNKERQRVGVRMVTEG